MERRRSLAAVAVLVGALALGLGVTTAVREGLVATAWWRTARFAYEHDQHRPARFLLREFARHHAEDERAVIALNLLVDDFAVTEEWAALDEEGRRLRADPRLAPCFRRVSEHLAGGVE